MMFSPTISTVIIVMIAIVLLLDIGGRLVDQFTNRNKLR